LAKLILYRAFEASVTLRYKQKLQHSIGLRLRLWSELKPCRSISTGIIWGLWIAGYRQLFTRSLGTILPSFRGLLRDEAGIFSS
jgi:energy-converting hydrogenase Eha subunit G